MFVLAVKCMRGVFNFLDWFVGGLQQEILLDSISDFAKVMPQRIGVVWQSSVI